MTERTFKSEVFVASRLTSGNFFFPTRFEVSRERVVRIKPRLIGETEESIGMSKIASVHIDNGMFWSDVRIESAGGSVSLVSHGHTKADAKRIRELIERYQGEFANAETMSFKTNT